MKLAVGKHRHFAAVIRAFTILAALSSPLPALADEPYARSRDYDLQDIRTHLWFDLEHRGVRGEVTEQIASLRGNLPALKFDSVDLQINAVTVDGKPAQFTATPKQLIVTLDHPAQRGERHEVFIRYEGHPKAGLYFILPDRNYPQQPVEVWTQGEAEDTRYYIPVYDYPNDRLTSEMILTVPASWTTISNGKLLGVKNEPDGQKTWDWQQSEPLSTYLISVVAGEFVEREDSWHGIPLRFIVPRGMESSIAPTFARTKEMLDLFAEKLGVPYPWAQYAQTTVDEFTEGGMENTSATTLNVRYLINPALVQEEHMGSERVTSHELSHQWFGDLVTCKDWANLWLNEGFATFFEHYWTEQHYGADEADYTYWREQNQWFVQKKYFPVPIVDRNFSDSTEYEGNIYQKAGWVLRMLREKLGDADFFRSLHRYLEANRGQNVVTADLAKAIEQATAINTDQFFLQWIYRAGAPQFEIGYTHDSSARQIKLDVRQAQKAEGPVGLFTVPVDVEIATSTGRHTYAIEVGKAQESFTFPADGPPLMVVFDKGDRVFKTAEFQKDPALWIYQLKNGETVPDRADAATALGAVKNDATAVSALGEAAQHDPFWGVRAESLRALGRIGGTDAEKQILLALNDPMFSVREQAVQELGRFKEDSSLASTLDSIATSDSAYRVRDAALISLAQIKAPNAYDLLTRAVKSDSPEDVLRRTALRAFGVLGDARAVPMLLEWTKIGKPQRIRQTAIGALPGLDKKNKEITNALIGYLSEPYPGIRLSAIVALGVRRDPDAIAPIENLVKDPNASADERTYGGITLSLLKGQTPPTE